MAKDYYAILGVARTANDADIKKAFRKLAHEYHPDKQGGNETKFKEINEAYQVLGNAEKRKHYDQFGNAPDRNGGFQWQDVNTGGNPFGGFGGFTQSQSFDFGDLGDVLGDMFNFGGRTGRRSRTSRGNDVETHIPITFDEAYQGTEKDVTVSLLLQCDTCAGTGNDPGAAVVTCSTCKGSGVIENVQTTFLGAIRTQAVCSTCRGTGKRSERQCSACHGSTLKKQRQSILVKIPAGIDSDRAIRLVGKGEAGPHSGPRGDLYIRVEVATHSLFKREGYDIRSREEVPLSVLISGGTAVVQTPSGTAKLKIPAHTPSGTEFALRGKGFERLNGRGKGDQFVTIHAAVPQKITQRQKRALDDLEQDIGLKQGQKGWF